MPLTGQSALADASYMVSAPAKALIHSSVSDQNWKNCQLLRRRMAGFSAAVDRMVVSVAQCGLLAFWGSWRWWPPHGPVCETTTAAPSAAQGRGTFPVPQDQGAAWGQERKQNNFPPPRTCRYPALVPHHSKGAGVAWRWLVRERRLCVDGVMPGDTSRPKPWISRDR